MNKVAAVKTFSFFYSLSYKYVYKTKYEILNLSSYTFVM